MMRFLDISLIMTLLAIALLHLYWGFGGFWPGRDEASLVDMVMGLPPGSSIPPLWACAMVALCLLFPVLCVVRFRFLGHWALPTWAAWLPHVALWTSALVFLARGISTYVSPWMEAVKGTAFYELDRTIYAPLCLFLGTSLILVWTSKSQSPSGFASTGYGKDDLKQKTPQISATDANEA
jgi:hypothetical protein